MYKIMEDAGELENYAPQHPLNTPEYKRKLLIKDDVTTFCFYNCPSTTLMFTGYGDGLICVWDINELKANEELNYIKESLVGHTNKINNLEAVEHIAKVFSCSNDCTLRQWSVEALGVCERIFKFADPVNVCKFHEEK